MIEIKLKHKKIQIIRRYTEHYLLGLRVSHKIFLKQKSIVLLMFFQALAINFLQQDSSDIVLDFSEMLEYGEQIVWGETICIEEMYAARGERQKMVLLEKVSSHNSVDIGVLLKALNHLRN